MGDEGPIDPGPTFRHFPSRPDPVPGFVRHNPKDNRFYPPSVTPHATLRTPTTGEGDAQGLSDKSCGNRSPTAHVGGFARRNQANRKRARQITSAVNSTERNANRGSTHLSRIHHLQDRAADYMCRKRELEEAQQKQTEWRKAAHAQAGLSGGALLFTRDALTRSFGPPFTGWQKGEDDAWIERALSPNERYQAIRRAEKRHRAHEEQKEPAQDVLFVRKQDLVEGAEVPPEAYVDMAIAAPQRAKGCRPWREGKEQAELTDANGNTPGASSSGAQHPLGVADQPGTYRRLRPGNSGTRPTPCGTSSPAAQDATHATDPRSARRSQVPFTPINNTTNYTPLRVKKVGSPIADP